MATFITKETLAYFKSKLDVLFGNKVDKVEGKGLSANDYTTEEKTKLAGIATGAEVNVNADWNATEGDAQILNKPVIPEAYTLPQATTEALGGVKVGAGLAINAETGVLSATGSGTADAVDWENVTSKPTTVEGYGITDAVTTSAMTTALADYTTTTNLAATYATTSATTAAIATAVTDMATQTYVDGKVTGVYHFKGSVADLTALQAVENPAIGDVYNITATGMNAGWTGSAWDEFGTVVDLSPYMLTANMTAITNAEIDTIFAGEAE